LSSFDQFDSDENYDAIFFYECLHHSVRPWHLLQRLKNNLNANGKIVLSGEPINEVWWKHWGIRLDPLSLYCIRKYGWFESGFSMGFLHLIFDRIGLMVEIINGRSINGSDIIIAGSSVKPKPKLFYVVDHLVEGNIKIDVTLPLKTARCSEQYSQNVVVSNLSSFLLSSSCPQPINISYHWRNDDGECVNYNGLRTMLSPLGLLPGCTQEREVKISTPSAPGIYLLEITLVQEGVAWFEDYGFCCASHKVAVG
jgi:hypothetical protein